MPRLRSFRCIIIGIIIAGLLFISNYIVSSGSEYHIFESQAFLMAAKTKIVAADVIISRNLLNSSSQLNDSIKSLTGNRLSRNINPVDFEIPTIYMVTPTYRRAEQIPELTRTCQTLRLVSNLVWIVVEDAPKPSVEVLEYLKKCQISYVYLRAEMPEKFLKVKNKPRGVANRNAAIEYVRKNVTNRGVIYFGDDDNTYDIQVFEEMRWTKGVSMFPVGLVTAYSLSTPIVREGKVIGFYDGWIANRKFPVDMAEFAINIELLKKFPTCNMPFVVGYEESRLLQCLKITMADIEPKAKNCTEILVWHTQTKKNKAATYDDKKLKLENTNLPALTKKLWKGS